LVKDEVGRVTLVGLAVEIRPHVLSRGLTQDPRNRQVIRQPVSLCPHRPVEERSRRPTIPILERVVISDPEVDEDGPNDWVQETTTWFLSVRELGQRLQALRKLLRWRRTMNDRPLQI